MRKNLVLSLCIALMAGFTACNDNDPPPYFEGDVRIVSKSLEVESEENGTITKYGLEFEVLGNRALSQVTVVGPNQQTYELTVTKGSRYASLLQEDKDFVVSTAGLQGEYNFTIMMESGETYTGTISNALKETSDIPPAKITRCEYNVDNNNKRILLQWEEIDDAWYIVRVKNENNDILYEINDGSGLPFSYKALTEKYEDGILPISSSSWKTGPTDGTTYTIEVNSYKFESTTYWHHLPLPFQEGKSIATKTVVWGQEPEPAAE